MVINDDMKMALIGGVAGVISRSITSPLELIKIYKQNYYLYNSTNINNIIKNEGILSLWKGNLTNCIRIFPNSAINFTVFNYIQSNNNLNNNNNFNNFLCGTISAIFATTLTYPLDNAKTRLSIQVNNNYYNNLYDVFKKTPINKLYNGYRMTICGFVPYNSFSFMFYNYYKQTQFTNHKIINNFFAGGLSGISAVSITYPTDLIRRRLQIQDLDTHNIKYNGIVDCIKHIYKVDGVKGFYRGLGFCYIKIFPAMAIQFCIVDCLKN
jgi:hypothetical protein